MISSQNGKIILINGASSAGKSTLAAAVHKQLNVPFIRFTFDQFIDSNAFPSAQIRAGAFSWQEMRPAIFDGYHRCWPALAGAGNNLLIDHIIEQKSWIVDLTQMLNDFDVFCVALHCSIEELERREIARGDRGKGDARRDLEVVHKYTSYDLELNSEDALDDNVQTLIKAWTERARPSAFEQMVAEFSSQ